MSNRSFAAMRQEADRIIERYKAQVARQVASINRLLTIRQGYLDLIGKIKYTLQIPEPDAQVLNRIIELIQEFENQSEEGKEMGQNLEPEKVENPDEAKITGPDGEAVEPTPDEHDSATQVVEDDDDVELSDNQERKVDEG